MSLYARIAGGLPRPAKEAVRTRAVRWGCAFARLVGSDTVGTHLQDVLAARQIAVAIDAGAHVGQFGQFLRNIGFGGRIISFEPIAENFAALSRQAAGDPLWVTLPYALGREDAWMELNVARTTQFSSFLSTSRYSAEEYGGWSEVVRRERVRVRSLDSLLASGELQDPGSRVFLKMDTQGYDLEVIGGATTLLPSVQVIQSEIAAIALYDGMLPFEATIAHFASRGFSVTGLYPVNRDRQHRVVEFDCIMVRSNERAGEVEQPASLSRTQA